MQKIEPNTIEGFQRDFTGLLSPDGKFYYSGRFGHDSLCNHLANQYYGVDVYGLRANDFMYQKNWFTLRHTSLDITLSPSLGYNRLWYDENVSFNWPTPEQLSTLREIEAIVGFKYEELEYVDDVEYYLWQLQRFEEISKEVTELINCANKERTTKIDLPKLPEENLLWYGFWCCTPSETNPLLKEVIYIRSNSQVLANNYKNIIFNQTPPTHCPGCQGNEFRYPIQDVHSAIMNMDTQQFARTIALVDLPKGIYWSGDYITYVSQYNNGGLEWQILKIE